MARSRVEYTCKSCGLIKSVKSSWFKGPRFTGVCHYCTLRRHGDCRTRPYRAWQNMVERCTNPHATGYNNYGGRGITVCERWLKYENFRDDMGYPPDGMSLDRIDNDGNYCPENCHWATPEEQLKNKRSTRLLTYRGRTQTLAQWARETGIAHKTLCGRMDQGRTAEDILTAPSATKPQYVTYEGKTQTYSEWSKETGLSADLIYMRIKRGMSPQDALTLPSNPLIKKA